MKSQKIFRIFGIDIQLHYSWYLIFVLLTWSLATAYFPLMLPNQTTQTYWITGAVAAIFLFISVLLHELSHSLVARIKNIKVEQDSQYVRPTAVPRLIGDTSKFHNLTGWEPKISIDIILDDTLEYWRNFVKNNDY